jgi:glycosyltransferase involved in cell wall biosynthesis
MGVFPSYYEPWGYTPLESCAFRIPTVTTDLAGFGRWATQATAQHDISPEGVTVIDRTDSNYMQAAEALMQTILRVSTFNRRQINIARRAAATLAERASWNHFIQHYYEAYDIALTRAAERIATN